MKEKPPRHRRAPSRHRRRAPAASPPARLIGAHPAPLSEIIGHASDDLEQIAADPATRARFTPSPTWLVTIAAPGCPPVSKGALAGAILWHRYGCTQSVTPSPSFCAWLLRQSRDETTCARTLSLQLRALEHVRTGRYVTAFARLHFLRLLDPTEARLQQRVDALARKAKGSRGILPLMRSWDETLQLVAVLRKELAQVRSIEAQIAALGPRPDAHLAA